MPYYLANMDPRQIRRDVRSVVLCVTAFIFTMNLVLIIVVAVAVIIENPALFSAFIPSTSGTVDFSSAYADISQSREFNDAVYEASVNYAGLGLALGMISGLPWFFIIRGKSFLTRDITRVHSKVSPTTICILIVFILGVQFAMVLMQIGVDLFFPQGSSSLTDTLEQSTTSLALSPFGALYIVLFGPICEELVFRGAVMRKLERYGANFAIVVSALIFGLYHMILFQTVFAFFIGLILAYTAGRFSLKWAVLLHVLNNGLAVLPFYIGNDYFEWAILVCWGVAFVATIIILIVGRKFLYAQKTAGAPSEPAVFPRAFLSPWLIIYILITMFMGILTTGLL